MNKETIKELASKYFNEIIDIRRHLHQFPELSFQEHKTSKYISGILTKWNINHSIGYANTGIVAIIEGKNPQSNVVALRADFDALPIQEENKVDYCSKNDGIMHACGHDAHTSSLLGTVRILNDLKDNLTGTVKFIFQPAEEMIPGGAKQMIEEGVMDKPKVKYMFGQHVFPDLEVGMVGFCPGKYMASTDELYFTIKGKGGHAAIPEKNINPIVIGSILIQKLYEHFDKEKNRPSVFSIGYINGEGSTNIVPDIVSLKGTFRCMDERFRSLSHRKMLEICDFTQSNHNVKIELNIKKGYPYLENDVTLTTKAISYAKEFLSESQIVELPIRMTAEDFSYYTRHAPSCFYRLGTANKKKGITHGLHTSRFDIDEKSLEIGMGLMSWIAIRTLEN